MSYEMPPVKCPRCPICGGEPLPIELPIAQWFCANDECQVFCWDPWSTQAENLADQGQVEETSRPLQGGAGGPTDATRG